MISTITDRIARALVALSIVVMPACGRPDSGWSRVDLAHAGEIVALAPAPGGLLVGRYDPTTPTRSSIQAVDLVTGEARSVPLMHGVGYAAEARLVSISAAGDQVIALGAARGGAHGNPRWTVWSGGAHGLSEQPQTLRPSGAGTQADWRARRTDSTGRSSWEAGKQSPGRDSTSRSGASRATAGCGNLFLIPPFARRVRVSPRSAR